MTTRSMPKPGTKAHDAFVAHLREFVGPKSICRCRHTGDGRDSMHTDPYGPFIGAGHGRCRAPGCKCERFSFLVFRLAFTRHRERWFAR